MSIEGHPYQVAGLFAGVGALELGLEAAGHRTALLCDVWDQSRRVLADRFGGIDLHGDVADLKTIPVEVGVVAAGFPCTDLSQAGQMAGINGSQSGSVSHVFRLLRDRARSGHPVDWLVMENVPNMLRLDGGWAMSFLQQRLSELGMHWAYRTVDSRAFGVPQRRRRVVLVASALHDPRAVLFADEVTQVPQERYSGDLFGFYWTEGRTGLGWAVDAVPPLKGGSSLGIPSPPGIWVPGASSGRSLVQPSIEDAEELQGLPRGWTKVVETGGRNGPRWRLVGNAVTVGMAEWLGKRLASPGEPTAEPAPLKATRWPAAAYGYRDRAWGVAASEHPVLEPYTHLRDVVDVAIAEPVSHRGSAGFWSRLQKTKLGQHPGFREAVADHVAATGV